MDDDLWIHSDEGYRRTVLGLLERIADALESKPMPVTMTINGYVPEDTEKALAVLAFSHRP